MRALDLHGTLARRTEQHASENSSVMQADATHSVGAVQQQDEEYRASPAGDKRGLRL